MTAAILLICGCGTSSTLNGINSQKQDIPQSELKSQLKGNQDHVTSENILADAKALSAYQAAKRSNSIAAYQDFIKIFPDSKFVSDATSRSEELHFTLAKEMNTILGYFEFLKQYPRTTYRSDIMQRISKISWEDAREKPSLFLFSELLDDYPDSEEVKYVRSAIEELVVREIFEQNSIFANQEFLDRFPNSSLKNGVNDRIEKLAFQRSVDSNSILALLEFLRLYPDSQYSNVVREQLEKKHFEMAMNTKSLSLLIEHQQKYPKSRHQFFVALQIESLSHKPTLKGIPVASHGHAESQIQRPDSEIAEQVGFAGRAVLANWYNRTWRASIGFEDRNLPPEQPGSPKGKTPSIPELEQQASEHPEVLEVLIRLAEALIARNKSESGDSDRAIGICQKILKHYPNHMVARYGLAVAYYQTNELDKSLREVDFLIAKSPILFDYLVLRGKIRIKLEHYSSALKDIEKAISVYNRDFEPFFLKGKIYCQHGDSPATAIENLTHALTFNPEQPEKLELMFLRATQYLVIGKPYLAKSDLGYIVRVAPDSRWAKMAALSLAE